MMAIHVDLNADVGEGTGSSSPADDERLLVHLTSASIACGFHAGDDRTMDATVAACARLGVAIGAHPGYADRGGFGRRAMTLAPDEVEKLVRDQIAALDVFCRAHRVDLQHVKPHGALYNQAASDPVLAGAIARAVGRVSRSLSLYGLASSTPMADAAADAGLRFVPEAFADRRYLADGSLQPRAEPGSVISDPSDAAAQAVSIARDGTVTTSDGTTITLRAETICLHGDTPGAVDIAKMVRDGLVREGVVVGPMTRSAPPVTD